MKLFKQSLALLLALTILVSLVACKKDQKQDTKADPATESSADSNAADLENPEVGTDELGQDLQAAAAEEARAEFEKQLSALVEVGQPYVNEPAYKIEDQEIPVHVLNFYSALASKMVNPAYQSGTFAVENRALLNTPSTEDAEKTQRDEIIDFALKQVKFDYVSKKAAAADKFEPIDAGSDLAEQVLGQLAAYSAQSGFELDQLLTLYYGWGNDEETLKALIAEYFELEQYREHLTLGQEVSKQEIEKEFEEHKENYEVLTFRVMNFTPDASEYMSDEALAELAKAEEYSEELDEKAPANPEAELSEEELKANVELRAKAMQERVKSEEDFVRLQAVYAPPAVRAQLKANPEISLQKMSPAQLPEEMKNFLNSPERKAGDTEIVETPFGTWLVFFIERGRDESRAFTTRHILIQPEDPSSDEAWESAKARLEEILEQYKDGDKTEEAFAELANEHSQDPGNQGKNGGLYDSIEPGKFVKEYEEWALAKERKEADVEIVKTEHGYHLIYFIRLEEPKWYRQCQRTLALEKTKEWLESEIEKLQTEELEGLKYVLPSQDPSEIK